MNTYWLTTCSSDHQTSKPEPMNLDFFLTRNLFVFICSKLIFVWESKQTKNADKDNWYDRAFIRQFTALEKSANLFSWNKINKLLDNWIMNKQDKIHLKKWRNVICKRSFEFLKRYSIVNGGNTELKVFF